MNSIAAAFSRAGHYLATIGISDIIDILIVTYLIYEAIQIIRRTNSYNLAKGLLIFIVVLWIAEIFNLNMISFILRKATELGVILLVILFQPELRRVLEKLGSKFSSRGGVSAPSMETAISQTVMACSDMSASRTGALIIFERHVSLNDIIATGTVIDSSVSAELLKNMFFDKAPLHDGAVIIRDGRVAAAGCVLPLSSSSNISKELGMRHRAGIGLSEQSDALVLVVSEETGAISCCIEGTLKRHLSPKAVDSILRKELMDDSAPEEQQNIFVRIFKAVFMKKPANPITAEKTADEKNL